MSEVPGLVWQHLLAQNSGQTATAFSWTNANLAPGDPPGMQMPAGYTLKAGLLVLGSSASTYSFEVLVNAGSDDFQLTDPGSLLSGGELRVGMPVVPSVQVVPPAGLPNGLVIAGINQPTAGSILLGGIYPGPGGGTSWLYTQPSSETIVTTLTAIDEYPYGWLTTTVTPSAGVTLVDYAYDGTGNPSNVGDGSEMMNSGGQAMGVIAVTFADPGGYTIATTFTSTDQNYADTSGSASVNVT